MLNFLRKTPEEVFQNQFPLFVQGWAPQLSEIEMREYEHPDGLDFDEYSQEDQNNCDDFYDRKEYDLNAHAELIASHYSLTLPQLLGAVLHSNPIAEWPSDFTPEFIQRVVHECTAKERRQLLEFLPESHPLQSIWWRTMSESIPLSDSNLNILL
ncbi:MAG: hypothetical protein ACTSVZ_00085 [Promethearchaeota archaeon]